MLAVGEPGFQQAVARAYNSRWGLGGGAYHSADAAPGEAESAYLGVMRREALDEVGGFDTTLARGEDWELNHRFRLAGHRVWLDPTLQVKYRPRATPAEVVRQFWATGVWRAGLVRRLKAANSRRYFVPPALVVCTAVAAGAGGLAAARLGGRPMRLLAGVAGGGVGAYGALIAGIAGSSDGSGKDRLRYAAALVAMHYSWGSGFLYGLLRGPAGTVDTSRIVLPRVAATTPPGE
jgi:hypothetical protein